MLRGFGRSRAAARETESQCPFAPPDYHQPQLEGNRLGLSFGASVSKLSDARQAEQARVFRSTLADGGHEIPAMHVADVQVAGHFET